MKNKDPNPIKDLNKWHLASFDVWNGHGLSTDSINPDILAKKTDKVDDEGNPIFEASSGNQVLINSDRIIFNSKLDDIFVSSIKDIYIGAGVNLSLTSPTLNLVSDNVNIGSPNKEGVVMESMVLGDKLLEILSELFTELKAATSLFYGSPLPLMDQTGGTPLSVKLSTIEAKLKDLLSKKHKIEQG